MPSLLDLADGSGHLLLVGGGSLLLTDQPAIGSWTAEMLDLWYDLVAEFGATATYGAWSFDCVRNPIKSGFQMMQAGYNQQADTTIDILRTQAVTIGLYGFKGTNPQQKRPVFVSDGMSFQVLYMENDDTAQPSVRFMCAKVLASNV